MTVVSGSFRARIRTSIEQPVGRVLGRLGVTPNALTLVGFGIAVVGALLAARASWLEAGLVVGFGAIFDLFDGALARATGRTSRLGAFLDSVFDRAGEAVVYIGIAFGLGVPDIEGYAAGGEVLALAAMAASFMVSYTRAKSEGLGFTPGSGMANIGLAPREVRLIILVVGLTLTGLAGGMGSLFYPNAAASLAMYGSLLIITVLATLTTIQRIVHVVVQSRKQEN
jgi:CDP-diacylglycerol--glycerol-3-phosphate 3-phosphatidyltransferase